MYSVQLGVEVLRYQDLLDEAAAYRRAREAGWVPAYEVVVQRILRDAEHGVRRLACGLPRVRQTSYCVVAA